MKQDNELRMKHSDPIFGEFVGAYLLVVGGGLSTVMNLLEWAFAGKGLSREDLYLYLSLFCGGIVTLLLLRRQRRRQLAESAQEPLPH